MTITQITLTDDGRTWITVSAEIDAPTEPTGVRHEVLQTFGYVLQPRGPLLDVTNRQKARARALAWAEAYAERHGCQRIIASWWAANRAA